jgi:sterol 14-demethylase
VLLHASSLLTHDFTLQTKKSSQVDAFTTSSEITICTASATLQGKEVREALDKSFAQLYHDLDGGFTPIVCTSLSTFSNRP